MTAYDIFRGNELIGRLPLDTIMAIHGDNITAICDISGIVTVNESRCLFNDFSYQNAFVVGSDGRKWLV